MNIRPPPLIIVLAAPVSLWSVMDVLNTQDGDF